MRRRFIAVLVLVTAVAAVGQPPAEEVRGEARSREVGDIPPVLYTTLRTASPTFVTADVAIGPDGELNEKLLSPLARTVLGNLLRDHQGGCVEYQEVWVQRVNPADRSSLAKAVRASQLILEASVTARDYGFYDGDIPGQLLEIETDQVIRGRALDRHFIFVPVGRFDAGPYTFCKTDSRLPEPPDIGDRVLLLIPEIGDPEEPLLDLHDEFSLIVLDDGGGVGLPKGFSRSGLTRDELIGKVKGLARER